jgi:hypothetical protein
VGKSSLSLSTVLSTLDLSCVQITGSSNRFWESLRSVAFYLSVVRIETSLFFLDKITAFNFVTNLVLRLQRVCVTFRLPSLAVNVRVTDGIVCLLSLVRDSVACTFNVFDIDRVTHWLMLHHFRARSFNIVILH